MNNNTKWQRPNESTIIKKNNKNKSLNERNNTNNIDRNLLFTMFDYRFAWFWYKKKNDIKECSRCAHTQPNWKKKYKFRIKKPLKTMLCSMLFDSFSFVLPCNFGCFPFRSSFTLQYILYYYLIFNWWSFVHDLPFQIN